MSNQKFFPWKPTYATGIDLIDSQHQKLVEYINELYDTALKSETSNKTKSVIIKLFEYIDTHFRDEENMMQKANYASYSEHIKEHHTFEKKLKEYDDDFTKGFPVTFQLLNFLREWLQKHILETDQQYVPHV